MQRVPWITAGILLALAATVPLIGQAPQDPLLADIFTELVQIEGKIAEWNRKADILLAMVLAVGILGMAISAIQALNRPWSKPASIIIGLVVSVLTLLHQQLFPADRGTFQSVALDARRLVREVRENLRLLQLDPTMSALPRKLDFLRTNVTPKLISVYDLEKRLLVKGSTVQAQSKAPAPLDSVGIGECNTSWQAQQNAQVAATEKLVQALKRSRSGAWSPAEIDDLRRYVTSYANTSGRNLEFDRASGMFRYTTEMQFHPVFLKDQLIQDYLRQQQQPVRQTAPAAQRLALSLPSVSRLQGLARLPVEGSGIVKIEARNPKEGSFQFRFTLARQRGDAIRVALDSIEVHQDASALSTRWAFEVYVNGQYLFDLPMQRWDDSARPTRCRLDQEAGFGGLIPPVGRDLEVKVVGYKPKDL